MILPLPPQNDQAEQAVVASISFLPEMLPQVAKHVSAEDFYYEANRNAYAAVSAAILAGLPVAKDGILMIDALMAGGKFTETEAKDYFLNFVEPFPSGWNAVPYARIVQECSLRRRLNADCLRLAEDAHNRAADLSDVLAAVQESVNEIASRASVAGDFDFDGAIQRVLDKIHGKVQGVTWSTGNSVLDEMIGGFQRQTTWALGAHPKHGKTALACQFTDATIQAGLKVLHVRYEEPAHRILLRIASLRSGVAYAAVNKGTLNDDERARILAELGFVQRDYRERFKSLDRPGMPEIEAHVQTFRPALVIVDTIQKMGHAIATQRRDGRHDLHIARLTEWLEMLAVRYDCCVLFTSQVQKASGASPTSSQLRESGSIEEDAYVVLMLYWPAKANMDKDIHRFVISVAKNRDGGETRRRVFEINPETQALTRLPDEEERRFLHEP